MLLCINFATGKGEGRDFLPWQKLQTQTAYLFGADKVREYSMKDIHQAGGVFYEKNKFILDQKRGAGYWLWKPYIIKDALSTVDDGDYVFYVDSGAFYINDIKPLIDAMEAAKTDILPVLGGASEFWFEKNWTKRDAFILMDCDEEKYYNSPQRIATFIFLKKSANSIAFVDEWLEYMQDPRIVTDMPNQLGKENYEGFKENRHDQTVLSLLTKKHDIKPFRSPSIPYSSSSKDYLKRSSYPQIVYHHRRSMPNRNLTPQRYNSYVKLNLLPQFISIASRIQNKELIPEEFQYGLPKAFQDGLAYFVEEYIKQRDNLKELANLPSAQEILTRYCELGIPETPFLKEAIANMPKSLY